MDLYSTKGRGRHGMRVSPHCRGAASSMLRVSHPLPSGFGGLGRHGVSAQRLAQSLAVLSPAGSLDPGTVPPTGPLFTRLWPSASLSREALWQDTLAAAD